MQNLSSFFIITGLVFIVIGLYFYFKPSLPLLPGDILYQKDNFTFYFPIVTSLIASILLTIIMNLFK